MKSESLGVSLSKLVLSVSVIVSVGALFGATAYLTTNKLNLVSIQPQVSPAPEPTSTPIVKEGVTNFSCGTSTVKDIDSNIYNTVQIGSQCWMKENLKVTKNPQGEAITRYCYNDDPKICETDGGLYNWNTAMNNSAEEGVRGICLNGWHVPKDSEWYVLEKGLATGKCNSDRNYEYSCDPAGAKLKVGGLSGFNGILTGYRHKIWQGKDFPLYSQEIYDSRGEATIFWSSSSLKENKSLVWVHHLNSSYSAVYRNNTDKTEVFSLRCIKN